MNTKELIEAFAKGMAKQGRPVYGVYTEGTNAPLLPYLSADLILQIYNNHIAGLDLRHEAKKARKGWHDAYVAFNRPFFKCFNDEQRDAVIDYMDNFEKQVGNAVEICRLNLFDYCPKELPLEKRMTLSYMMLANVLATGTQGLWGVCFRKPPKMAKIGGAMQCITHAAENEQVAAIKKHTYNLMLAYCPQMRSHQVASMDGLYKAWDVVCARIAEFVGE